MLDGQFRSQIDAWTKPVGQSMKRTGITADVVTIIGLVMSVGCAVALAYGAFNLAFLLLLLTGIPDLIDGAVAKATGSASPRGAFLDSVTDRLTDGLLFGGVAWYLTTVSDGPLPLLPFAVFLTASLVSYMRAKADALGFDAHGGLVERAERFILLGVGILFSQVLVPVLWILLALNVVTATQRFVKVWQQGSEPRHVPLDRRPRRRPRAAGDTAGERWRNRRLEARERAAQRRRP